MFIYYFNFRLYILWNNLNLYLKRPTDRTFFGYIVILKDVVVKPLYTNRLKKNKL